MRKPLIALVALGLVAGAVAAPAQAKKKKKPKPKPPVSAPVQMDQKYYLVNTSGGCLPEDMHLLLTPAEEGGSCGSRINGPVATALDEATGTPCAETPVDTVCAWQTYTASEGLPVTLDGTKKITGTIIVRSGKGVAENPASLGAGPSTFNLALDATANGEAVVLGTFSSEYTVTPDKDAYEVPFELTIDPALDKAEVTALSVRLWNTGASSNHGHYEVNTSNIVLPIWKLAS